MQGAPACCNSGTTATAGAGAFSDGKLSLSEEVGGNLPDYLPRQQVRELIHYCDEQYLAFGAPDIVHGRNDPKVEEFKYEASKYNIQLVPCPVRHMGTEYSFEVLRANRSGKWLPEEPAASPEAAIRKAQEAYFKKVLHGQLNLAVVYAFLTLKEYEGEMLRRVFVALRYGLDPAEFMD